MKADTLSLTTWQVGGTRMYGFMAFAYFFHLFGGCLAQVDNRAGRVWFMM